MFDSSRPPLLVQPIHGEHSTLFPMHEGYHVHHLSAEQTLLGFRDGWTFPVSAQQRKYVKDPPLLMVKNDGRVTMNIGASLKGYAHEYCGENGEAPPVVFRHVLFPDQDDADWMFIQDTVTMIWLQLGINAQFCGREIEKFSYGKLLIRRFSIHEDIAPGFDKKADCTDLNAKQFRVETQHLYLGSWGVNDESPKRHLLELLAAEGLDRFKSVVSLALERAGDV